MFVADHRKLAFGDVPGTQAALQSLLPGVEVERIIGQDWVNDPLALGTWCILRPGQLARLTPELRRTEGRLFFAGADSAPVWRSFIDGAIHEWLPRRSRCRLLFARRRRAASLGAQRIDATGRQIRSFGQR